MAFSPTDEQIQATETLLLAMAHEQTIEPIVTGYQKAILEQHQFHVASRWVGVRGGVDRIILDPRETYLLNEEDSEVYFRECDLARDSAGLIVEQPGFCPLLVAQNLRVQAEMALLDVMSKTPGLEHLSNVRSMRKDTYDEVLDLTLRMMTRFVREDLAEQLLAAEKDVKHEDFAQTTKTGEHIGRIEFIEGNKVFQSVGRGQYIQHELARFANPPKIGDVFHIKYVNGMMQIVEELPKDKSISIKTR